MTYQTIRPYGQSAGNAERLTVSGAYFVTPDGALHIRKSITAFTLSKRAAEGRDDDARRYMDWARSEGANEFRNFTESDWTGPPNSGVETGWTYSPGDCAWVLQEAAQRGCHVEMVAFTYRYDLDAMVAHLQAVDELCLAHPNALLSVANEPQRNNIPIEDILHRYTPRTPGWASGQYDPTPYPAGPSMTYHSPRKDEWSRCAKDVWEFHEGSGPYMVFEPPYHGPVMLDEPPQVEQTIRDEGAVGWPAEDDWRAYGAGCKFWGCGGTDHGNPSFQKCEIPTDPRVLACTRAFYAGFADVPTQRYQRYDRGDPPSSNPGSRRYFRWNEAGQKYQLCVRPFSFGAV